MSWSSLKALIDLRQDSDYLDIACGTGNYTHKLAQSGGYWSAIDQSELMLDQARAKNGDICFSRQDIQHLQFQDQQFNAITCTLAIHHFADLTEAFSEVYHVVKDQGSFVLFTSTPEQMAGYWLAHYFPHMMHQSCMQMPSIKKVAQAMSCAGLKIQQIKAFFIKPDLQDFFLYSGKQRPEMYLSKKIRDSISSFRNFCTQEELAMGLSDLKSDIESGNISDIISEYANDLGDYCFVVADKGKSAGLKPPAANTHNSLHIQG